MDIHSADNPNAVAVIGMSGRFPGARNLARYWDNLSAGVESVSFFTEDELLASGIPQELIDDPHYVRAASLLDDIDRFDARFFSFTPREAELTDPQHRLFLECAWEAMELAGYCGDTYEGAVGVFAGAGPSHCNYLASDTHLNPKLFGHTGSREHIGNDKDYLATRVSYKLNLRGPSITVQTACSTSLVAVHLACQSLILGESDLALAGGVTVRVPQKKGYFSKDNAICSPDGHCRAFDADADGTVFGSGVGIVVLKRLSAARRDGDTIHAVIRGTVVNNDGGQKISYWASSAEGQASAVIEAMAVADVDPESIGYVEAHGTGTSMGDPVEILALTQAFRTSTDKNGFCAIGSVKTNVGHLDSAAGIAGLLKAILALKHKAIPPTLHFKKPNPRIKFEATPFFVNTQRQPWCDESAPRRAAVNALGIGGTNAFAVLEEAPELPPREDVAERPAHLLTLSAKTPVALRELAASYAQYVREQPAASLVDICFTAAVGRAHLAHRLAVVAESVDQLSDPLETFSRDQSSTAVVHGQVPRNSRRNVAFLFSDLSDRSLETAPLFYRTCPAFRQVVDSCARSVLAETGTLLLPVLLPGQPGASNARSAKRRVVEFALDYAFASLWRAWIGEPAFVAGRGMGELTAACAAGVLRVSDAVRILDGSTQDIPRQVSEIQLAAPRCAVLSGSTGEPISQPLTQADWWCKHGEGTTCADDACVTIVQQADATIQIGAASSTWNPIEPLAATQNRLALGGLPASDCAWSHILSSCAHLVTNGRAIDWESFYAGCVGRRVELPTYPFQRKRFWSSPVPFRPDRPWVACESEPQQQVHEVLGRRVHSALHPEALSFETMLSGGSAEEMQRRLHKLSDAAAQLIAAGGGVKQEGLVLYELPDWQPQESRAIQLTLLPKDDGKYCLRIFSRTDVEPFAPAKWTEHLSATLILL